MVTYWLSSCYQQRDMIWDEKRRRDGLKTAFLRCGRPFPAAQTVRFRSVKGRLPPCKRLHSAKQTPWIRPERGVNMGVKPQADAIWRKTFVISFYFRPPCGCSFPPQRQPFRRAAAARPSLSVRCRAAPPPQKACTAAAIVCIRFSAKMRVRARLVKVKRVTFAPFIEKPIPS